MKTILINSAKLINQSEGREKAVAQYMFATAFCNLIRNGTLYRRENGIDGMPRLVIMLGNTEYKCPEYLVEKLINKNFLLNPYEDTSLHLDDFDLLPKPAFVDFTELEQNQSNKKKKTKSDKQESEEEQDVSVSKISSHSADKELIKQEVAKELEKEKAKLQKKMDAQLALNLKKQEELIIDEIDNTKVYKIVNIALGIFCTMAGVLVWVFL